VEFQGIAVMMTIVLNTRHPHDTTMRTTAAAAGAATSLGSSEDGKICCSSGYYFYVYVRTVLYQVSIIS